ncbi:hypothetical protein [Maritalea mediterranea]|uniref:Uncharacterized protein n=1 Tax=Maritalea mediterranea TaxID=2909667 RepID=A0ABS9EC31_9HYPH|nr:hypothetical protein [Maritalea mediterranea]MCF4099315.1 hypothetical protein [Maritalea mediterranea]
MLRFFAAVAAIIALQGLMVSCSHLGTTRIGFVTSPLLKSFQEAEYLRHAKQFSTDFYIEEHFPVGSGFQNLEAALLENGFDGGLYLKEFNYRQLFGKHIEAKQGEELFRFYRNAPWFDGFLWNDSLHIYVAVLNGKITFSRTFIKRHSYIP